MYNYKSALTLFALLLLSSVGFAQAPVAHFTSDCKVLCFGSGSHHIGDDEVGFKYDGTGSTPTSYEWTFPGCSPSSSASKNPGTVTFPGVGKYLISIKAKNSTDSSTFTDTITVINTCSANASVVSNSICDSSCINFFDKSNFQPDSWSWTFDNGSGTSITSFEQNPTNICYNIIGKFTVRLTASRTNTACFNQANFSAQLINVIKCGPIQSVNINTSKNCSNHSVSFSPTVTGGVGSLTYNWSFPGGNPSTSTDKNPQVIYVSIGTYSATLIVTDAQNHTATQVVTFDVNDCTSLDSLTIVAGSTSICQTDSVYFSAEFKGGKGAIHYNWSFPGATPSSATTATVAYVHYPSPGAYTARLIVSDSTSIADTATQIITVVDCSKDTLQIGNIDSFVCPCSTFQLPYFTKGKFAGSNNFYLWFGDSTGFNVINIISDSVSGFITAYIPCDLTPGSVYQLYLESTDPDISTNIINVTAVDTPTSSFTLDKSTVCTGANVKLTYTGSSSNEAHYNWGFNGGSAVPDTGKGPIFLNWATSGTKNVTLTVADGGCNSTATTKPVTVKTTPTATFVTDGDSVCIGDASSVLTYTGSGGGAATYTWNFDGGAAAPGSGPDPQTVTWPGAGIYNPSLTVTENSCTSTVITQRVVVAGVCLGINNISASTLQVYPNPAGDKLFISGYSLHSSLIEVTNILGSRLITQKATDKENLIDVSKLTPGVYFLSVKYANGGSEVRKFVKE